MWQIRPMPPVRLRDARLPLLHRKEIYRFIKYWLPQITRVPVTRLMKSQQWLVLSQLSLAQAREALNKNLLITSSCLKVNSLSVSYYFSWHVLRSSLQQPSTSKQKEPLPSMSATEVIAWPEEAHPCLFLPAMYRLCLFSPLFSLVIRITISLDGGKHSSDKDFKQVTLSTKFLSVLVKICLQTAQRICLSPH